MYMYMYIVDRLYPTLHSDCTKDKEEREVGGGSFVGR